MPIQIALDSLKQAASGTANSATFLRGDNTFVAANVAANSAIASPVFSGTAIGTYTLGGTPSLAATALTGTIEVARLGSSGTANNTTFLRGDNTWAVSSSGAIVLITAIAASGASYVDFTSGITSTYDEYLILMGDVVSNAGSGWINLNLRVSEDGGSTFKQGGSDYRFALFYCGSGSGSPYSMAGQSTGTTQILVHSDIGYNNSSYRPTSAQIRFSLPSGTTNRKIFNVDAIGFASDGNTYRMVGGGAYQGTTNAINAIRILPNSSTLTGNFYLYGYKKT